MSGIWIAVVLVLLAALALLLLRSRARERFAERRFKILDEIARVADGGGTLEATLEAIGEILVPEYADFCTIDLVDDGEVRRAAVRASGPDRAEIELRLGARRPALQEEMAQAAGVAPRQPRFFERASEADLRAVAEDDEDLEFLLGLGIRSGVAVELWTRGRVIGMLTMSVASSGRSYRQDDAQFAWILSGRVALALDNAGLFSDLERSERERAQIAETLQRGLLPPPLPHVPGWSIAAMYRPAGAENEIGGDFYDAFRVAGGWMVVIGDVTGRGAYAASVTAQARYTLRTAAQLTGDPRVALETLNRTLLTRSDSALCSVAAVVIGETPEQPVRMAVAGHPPPLLVDSRGVTEIAPSDPILGAFLDVSLGVTERRVEAGEQLVLVTDGITEAKGKEGRFGERRLRAALSGISSPALAAQGLEGALGSFTEGRMDDDVALLALAPAPAASRETIEDEGGEIVDRLFEAFNRRDSSTIVALCDEAMEFFPFATAEAVGRPTPYAGPEGLNEYLADVERTWEELLITPLVLHQRGGSILVQGRVYARGRELGIRDMPVAWIWGIREGRIIRGEVFPDSEQAVERFSALAADDSETRLHDG